MFGILGFNHYEGVEVGSILTGRDGSVVSGKGSRRYVPILMQFPTLIGSYTRRMGFCGGCY